MKLVYFLEPDEFNSFVADEYLQSWPWGEILKAEGREVLRLGVLKMASDKAEGGREILAAATLVKQPLTGGYFYWYAPRGPIISQTAGIGRGAIEDFLFSAVKKIDEKCLFLRLEPASLPTGIKLFLKKTVDLQPAKTLLLNLSSSEEELLSAMSQKTRYNIRLAEKKGVYIRVGTAADFSEFWRLLNLTGARDGFRIHDAAHYRALLAAANKFIKLFLAEYEGKVIAAGLFCFWGETATYLHGASDNKWRGAMAPYLLQWAAIKEARAAGLRHYDFYGIDEKKWPGVTRFKLGFGGRKKEYPGTYDLVFRPVTYRVYNFFRKLRRLV